MNSSERFYREKLYPFQDGILSIVKRSGIPFYLTGGTALSRHYYNHRYSEDLDLFVNNDANYAEYIDILFREMNRCEGRGEFSIDRQRLRRSKDHTQLYLIGQAEDENFPLRIDLVNDTAPHYGDFEMNDVLGKVDSVRNILSNKLSAVFRYEAKDIVDIWIIAKNERFNWQDVMNEAKAKEAGVDPIVLYEIMRSFPADALDAIKWTSEVDIRGFKSDLSCIADDILKGNDNTLE